MATSKIKRYFFFWKESKKTYLFKIAINVSAILNLSISVEGISEKMFLDSTNILKTEYYCEFTESMGFEIA